MKDLFLILNKEWFELIKSGQRRTESRAYKPYWIKRLQGKKYDTVTFQLGYAKEAPRMTFNWKGAEVIDHPRLGKVFLISFE